MVQRNGLRLQKLVNALLDFSRVEAGRIQAVYQPTDLASLTHDLASSFRSACEKGGPDADDRYAAAARAGLRRSRDVGEDRPQSRLQRVQVHAHGGITIGSSAERRARRAARQRYRHGHSRSRGAAHLRPLPSRRGRARPHLRRHRHRPRAGQGTDRAAQGHAFPSKASLDRGTTFTVRVPFGSAHLPQDRLDAARTQASTATRAEAFVSEALRWLPDGTGGRRPHRRTAIAPTGRGRTRLRGPARRRQCRHAGLSALGCSTPGYEVTRVADGEEALAAARRVRPDLILADVMMPRLDGFGLLQQLRDDPELRERAGDRAVGARRRRSQGRRPAGGRRRLSGQAVQRARAAGAGRRQYRAVAHALGERARSCCRRKRRSSSC